MSNAEKLRLKRNLILAKCVKSEQKCSRIGGKNPEPLLYLVHLLRPEEEVFEKRKRQLRRTQQHREART